MGVQTERKSTIKPENPEVEMKWPKEIRNETCPPLFPTWIDTGGSGDRGSF